MIKKLFLALSFFSVGCTTLYSVGPTAFVEQPEAAHSEKGHTEVIARTEPGTFFHLADDVSARPLKVTNPPDLQKIVMTQMGANLSLPNKLQIGFSGYPVGFWVSDLSFVLRGMIKYQFLGSAANEETSDPHRLSVFSHFNWSSVNRSGNQNGWLGPGGYPWKAQATFLGVDGGLSYGYRWNPRWMGYLGAAYEVFQINAKVHQDVSKTGDYPEADYSFPTSSGNSWTGTAGFLFGVKNRLVIYYSYSETNWNQLVNRMHFVSVGLSILDFDKKRSPVEPYR